MQRNPSRRKFVASTDIYKVAPGDTGKGRTNSVKMAARFTARTSPVARKAVPVGAENDRHPTVAARVAPGAIDLQAARLELAVNFAAPTVGTGQVRAILPKAEQPARQCLTRRINRPVTGHVRRALRLRPGARREQGHRNK